MLESPKPSFQKCKAMRFTRKSAFDSSAKSMINPLVRCYVALNRSKLFVWLERIASGPVKLVPFGRTTVALSAKIFLNVSGSNVRLSNAAKYRLITSMISNLSFIVTQFQNLVMKISVKSLHKFIILRFCKVDGC